MKNLNEGLLGAEIKEKGFECLQKELKKEYSFELVMDILSLPCLHFKADVKMSLLLGLLEDDEINDTIISMLCGLLGDATDEMWNNGKERLTSFIEGKHFLLSRRQILLLAHTIEIMYAKGYKNAFEMANLIYQRIPLSDSEFNPDSDDNVRIRLAKVAYGTGRHNFNERLATIRAIKWHLKESGREYLLGIVNYYKGLCLGTVNGKIGYKDAYYYMQKSKNRGFQLASVCLDYRQNNVETSSEC